MFGIMGWKQVAATFDMKRQAVIREVLEQEKIEYQLKVQDRRKTGVLSGNRRALYGSAGECMGAEQEYMFYVRKTEEEKACHVIERAGR